MGKYRFSVTGNAYIDDFGVTRDLDGYFANPNGMTDAQANNIITEAGATVRTTSGICSDRGVFRPRHAKFIREDGGQTQVIIRDRENANDLITTIRDAFNSAGLPIVCIDYVGEYWFNALEYFRSIVDPSTIPAYNPTAPVVPPAAIRKSKLFYGGTMTEYAGDLQYGVGYLQTFRSLTDREDNWANFIEGEAGRCAGAVEPDVTCFGSDYRRYRRWTLEFGTTTGAQSITIPQGPHDSSDIILCGAELSLLAPALCLSYQGEGHARAHNILA